MRLYDNAPSIPTPRRSLSFSDAYDKTKHGELVYKQSHGYGAWKRPTPSSTPTPPSANEDRDDDQGEVDPDYIRETHGYGAWRRKRSFSSKSSSDRSTQNSTPVSLSSADSSSISSAAHNSINLNSSVKSTKSQRSAQNARLSQNATPSSIRTSDDVASKINYFARKNQRNEMNKNQQQQQRQHPDPLGNISCDSSSRSGSRLSQLSGSGGTRTSSVQHSRLNTESPSVTRSYDDVSRWSDEDTIKTVEFDESLMLNLSDTFGLIRDAVSGSFMNAFSSDEVGKEAQQVEADIRHLSTSTNDSKPIDQFQIDDKSEADSYSVLKQEEAPDVPKISSFLDYLFPTEETNPPQAEVLKKQRGSMSTKERIDTYLNSKEKKIVQKKTSSPITTNVESSWWKDKETTNVNGSKSQEKKMLPSSVASQENDDESLKGDLLPISMKHAHTFLDELPDVHASLNSANSMLDEFVEDHIKIFADAVNNAIPPDPPRVTRSSKRNDRAPRASTPPEDGRYGSGGKSSRTKSFAQTAGKEDGLIRYRGSVEPDEGILTAHSFDSFKSGKLARNLSSLICSRNKRHAIEHLSNYQGPCHGITMAQVEDNLKVVQALSQEELQHSLQQFHETVNQVVDADQPRRMRSYDGRASRNTRSSSCDVPSNREKLGCIIPGKRWKYENPYGEKILGTIFGHTNGTGSKQDDTTKAGGGAESSHQDFIASIRGQLNSIHQVLNSAYQAGKDQVPSNNSQDKPAIGESVKDEPIEKSKALVNNLESSIGNMHQMTHSDGPMNNSTTRTADTTHVSQDDLQDSNEVVSLKSKELQIIDVPLQNSNSLEETQGPPIHRARSLLKRLRSSIQKSQQIIDKVDEQAKNTTANDSEETGAGNDVKEKLEKSGEGVEACLVDYRSGRNTSYIECKTVEATDQSKKKEPENSTRSTIESNEKPILSEYHGSRKKSGLKISKKDAKESQSKRWRASKSKHQVENVMSDTRDQEEVSNKNESESERRIDTGESTNDKTDDVDGIIATIESIPAEFWDNDELLSTVANSVKTKQTKNTGKSDDKYKTMSEVDGSDFLTAKKSRSLRRASVTKHNLDLATLLKQSASVVDDKAIPSEARQTNASGQILETRDVAGIKTPLDGWHAAASSVVNKRNPYDDAKYEAFIGRWLETRDDDPQNLSPTVALTNSKPSKEEQSIQGGADRYNVEAKAMDASVTSFDPVPDIPWGADLSLVSVSSLSGNSASTYSQAWAPGLHMRKLPTRISDARSIDRKLQKMASLSAKKENRLKWALRKLICKPQGSKNQVLVYK